MLTSTVTVVTSKPLTAAQKVFTSIILIDFDDAKYGESLYDVAIIIAFLFVSKKRGFMQDYIKLFIDTYYADDIALKEKEVPKIKDYALNWLSELMHTHNFNSSLKDSFENKYKLIKDNDLYGKN
jgi:Ser/Thr protein kinase RdoA (MazF antagonist)